MTAADKESSSSFELGTDGPSVIMVGVDDSTTSIRAGWYAAGLARRQRAKLVAVFVAPLPVRVSVRTGSRASAGAVMRFSRRAGSYADSPVG